MKGVLRKIYVIFFLTLFVSGSSNAQKNQSPRVANPCGNGDTTIELWGMTSAGGGGSGGGVIFKMHIDGSADTTLITFDSATYGSDPKGSLILAGNGKLYGITELGGLYGQGVIFSIDPVSGVYNVVFNFDSASGGFAFNSLAQANNGKLYGVTSGRASTTGYGVIFSFDIGSNTYTPLFYLNDSTGAETDGSLMQASNGKLYGMSVLGGLHNYGVLYSFDPSTNTYAKVLDFIDSLGTEPYGALMEAKNGKLYGMTSEAGSVPAYGLGVIFSYDPTTGIYQVLHYFNNPDSGWAPMGSLLEATDGKLYGLTSQGGDTGSGGLQFSYV